MKVKLIILIVVLFSGCSSFKQKDSTMEEVPQFVTSIDDTHIEDELSAKDKEEKFNKDNLDTFEKIYQMISGPFRTKKSKAKLLQKQAVIQTKSAPKRVESHIKISRKLNLRYSKKHYKFWLNYFSNRFRPGFTRHLKNSTKYREIVHKILKSYKLPVDLFYVALIESGFNSKIRSRASAVGHWQFMKGTATHYGLRVDRSIDERRSIYKSTHAAAKYFKDLYNIFGNWELALLAYNKGEYGVIRAIRKGNTRDYQKLVRKKLLPKETIYYIPKIVAAREIYKNLKKYKFKIPRPRRNSLNKYFSVKFKKSFDLSRVSKVTGVPKRTIRRFNPEIKHRKTKVSWRKPFTMYLPGQVNQKLVDSMKPIVKRKVASRKTSKKRKKSYISYKVRSGDNLTKIARKFKISIKRLKSYNSLRSNKIFANMRLKVPTGNVSYYTVKRGDNLTRIAKKFGLSVRKLVSYNSLGSKRIYPRQKLIIPVFL